MNVIIRTFQEKDFEPVLILWRISRERSLPDLERTKGHFLFEDIDFLRHNILLNKEVWVAVDEMDRPVGFLAMNAEFIDCLYVHPDHWRQGVGGELLRWAVKLSPERVWLYTLQINTVAQMFYEKNKFRIIARGISPAPESEPDLTYEFIPEQE
jgi:GNAT superfamily N-acetyltransferase